MKISCNDQMTRDFDQKFKPPDKWLYEIQGLAIIFKELLCFKASTGEQTRK